MFAPSPSHFEKHYPSCRNGGLSNDEMGNWLSLMAGFLFAVAKAWNCDGNVSSLVLAVQDKGCFPDTYSDVLPARQTAMWAQLDEYVGFRAVKEYCVSPPNSPAALTHHSVMSRVLVELKPELRKKMATLAVRTSGGGTILKASKVVALPTQKVKDGHCRLSPLLRWYGEAGLSGVRKVVKRLRVNTDHVDDTPRVSVVVSDCSQPRCLNELKAVLQNGTHSDEHLKVVFTVGMGPLEAQAADLTTLLSLAAHSRVRGIGECGYDGWGLGGVYSAGALASHLRGQDAKFQVHVAAAMSTGLPLVLGLAGHRGLIVTPDGVHEHAITVAMQAGLASQHPIHIHNFTGTYEVVKAWQAAFPRTVFGVGANLEIEEMAPVLRKLTLDQIILESGAPQSVPAAFTTDKNVANSLFYLDYRVRALLRLFAEPERAILRQLNANCARVYAPQ